jgi:DNA-3-methyladenine glycosylase
MGARRCNFVLFGPPRLTYVYFIYGNHYCFNVSCLPDGEAGSLFRRSSHLPESNRWRKRENIALDETTNLRTLTSGPGRSPEPSASHANATTKKT